MEQRVAVVTGAGAGIGSPIAEQLGKDGHYVVLADRDVEAATDAAQKTQAVGYGAHALRMDVGELESIDEAFRVIARDYGRGDVLVNNAGVTRTYAFRDYPDDDWQSTIAINLTGAFRCSQRATRMMVPRRWGRVANISSIGGMRAGTGRTAYGASKSGLNGLTRQIAIELAPFGITANAVAPGPIETLLAQALHTEATRRELCRLAITAGQNQSPLPWHSWHLMRRGMSTGTLSRWMEV